MAVLHQTSIDGPATLRRIGSFRFPMFELAIGGLEQSVTLLNYPVKPICIFPDDFS